MAKCLLVALSLLVVLVVSCSPNDPLKEDLYTDASYIRIDAAGEGGYWRVIGKDAINVTDRGSGATQLSPNISTLGGWWLNAITESLFFSVKMGDDWDGTTSAYLDIYFECNVDNTGGLVTDSVRLMLDCWHKILGERVCTNHSLADTVVVGQADQHDLFVMEIEITNIRETEIISFQLNLDTITSDVTSIIVNYFEFRYQSFYPEREVN